MSILLWRKANKPASRGCAGIPDFANTGCGGGEEGYLGKGAGAVGSGGSEAGRGGAGWTGTGSGNLGPPARPGDGGRWKVEERVVTARPKDPL